MAEKQRRTFEFRMSKKVAELTQVVHMLFTRNHEKEVEIEALKEVYEHEIKLVIDDAKSKMTRLEDKQCAAEQQMLADKNAGDLQIAQEMRNLDDEWRAKLQRSEQVIHEERVECQHVQDLLIQAQNDIETLRKGMSDQLSSKAGERELMDRELEKLRKEITVQEKRNKDQEQLLQERISDLLVTNENLSKELLQMRELLEETHKTKENLMVKTKQLETDLRMLRRDFSRKVSEIVCNSPTPNSRPQLHYQPSNKMEYNDELEKLRKEVQRYRMELTNRDSNFNRMFTEKQPVLVDPKAGRIGLQQHQALQSMSGSSIGFTTASSGPGVIGTGTQQSVMYTQQYSNQKPIRERSFAIATGHTYEEERAGSSRSSVSSASSISRFPTLSAEQKNRLNRLVKPRPLPRDLVYSKKKILT